LSAAPSRLERSSLLSPRVTHAGGAVRIFHSCNTRYTRCRDAYCARASLTRHLPAGQMDNALRLLWQSLHCGVGMRRACPCGVLLRASPRHTACTGSVVPRGAVRRFGCVGLVVRDATRWLYVYIVFVWLDTGCSGITSASRVEGLVLASERVHVFTVPPLSQVTVASSILARCILKCCASVVLPNVMIRGSAQLTVDSKLGVASRLVRREHVREHGAAHSNGQIQDKISDGPVWRTPVNARLASVGEATHPLGQKRPLGVITHIVRKTHTGT